MERISPKINTEFKFLEPSIVKRFLHALRIRQIRPTDVLSPDEHARFMEVYSKSAAGDPNGSDGGCQDWVGDWHWLDKSRVKS